MTDRQVGALAAGVWIGAWIAIPVPAIAVGLIVFIGLWRHIPAVVACGACALASMLAAAAPPATAVAPGAFAGDVLVATDPEPITRGVAFDVVADGVRLEAIAWGSAAGELRPRLLGERISITGSIARLESPDRWAALRGVNGRLTIDQVDGWETGRLHHRIANAIRRTISGGAESLPRSQGVLLVGLVYGDDRDHSAIQRDNFAAAGLTHLLAVSGQNVAFTLVLVGPLLRRFDYRGRFAVTLAVLFLFATLTRFEPSVLRASTMAAVAALAVVTARPASSLRILALAVSAVILLDTRIVDSVGFQLSVAASLGILVLAPRLLPLIRAPRVLSEALAVTAAAQLAVAPLLLWKFDELPVASLPANVLAGPVAGPVMMWGLTAGLLAGVARPLAPMLHAPTGIGLAWIDSVASVSAAAPLGSLGAVHVVVLGVGIGVALIARADRLRRIALAAVIAALVTPGLSLSLAAPSGVVVDGDVKVWRDEQVTVVELGTARTEDLLATLRHAQISSADVVVVGRGNLVDWDRVRSVRQRVTIREVWAPRADTIPGVHVPAEGATVRVADRQLHVMIEDGRLFLSEDP